MFNHLQDIKQVNFGGYANMSLVISIAHEPAIADDRGVKYLHQKKAVVVGGGFGFQKISLEK